ncbi:putative ABC Methanesulfonate (MSA) transporter, ATP-binding protein [Candidatus Filomicrobium marinum]|uniref:NitT/TauT family transport system ATP-binding protein n=2 Tax=Filomicrobium TaxID=119044 RepID=A0A1H0PPJ3_9HYPH|nr:MULTISPECIES: ABC transporter ATP-binding protein [Filomicrobium]AIY69290.1 putative ABC MSA transporter ATP-binding component [Candidatus Filomicrobium marinum]MCV0369917.1 ABC transporter ATP-binding protein [Filomicrobium sp.]CFX53773.1 putative ABC Methanesulfonate (MSA) transporter, ATP-binding protein [Candidatus Filomicrobium marinum]CPR19904.1 putative ABC Methanesulfonate (MSA) transporter, ATP-binding component [Candidatus Filomicrobium marinum]SDP06973.1 NitT/TauT family transpor
MNVSAPFSEAGTPHKKPEQALKGAISIRNVTKIYDPEGVNVMAVDNASMEIAGGEVCMIVGPSGCGKTTLLNAIAGFHSITSGEIRLDGELLCGPGKPKAKQGADRMVVFQHGALFPWKTLAENVAYGPIVQGALSKSLAMEKARHMLADAGLGDVGNKYPGEVSSGMARRAEIVRALINDPKVLLLDEPYRAMDALTKSIMHESLLETYDRTKVTIFFITHDLEEAIFLGDKVHIVTTRPCQLKKTVNVDIPRPRSYAVQSSEQFRVLMEEVNEAVHEEAIKAFEAGERELA